MIESTTEGKSAARASGANRQRCTSGMFLSFESCARAAQVTCASLTHLCSTDLSIEAHDSEVFVWTLVCACACETKQSPLDKIFSTNQTLSKGMTIIIRNLFASNNIFTLEMAKTSFPIHTAILDQFRVAHARQAVHSRSIIFCSFESWQQKIITPDTHEQMNERNITKWTNHGEISPAG